jgi:hypothetical protein
VPPPRVEHQVIDIDLSQCRRDRDELRSPGPAVAGPDRDATAGLSRDHPHAVVAWSHSGPVGTVVAGVSRHSRMKPGGERRSRARGEQNQHPPADSASRSGWRYGVDLRPERGAPREQWSG